MTEADTPTIQLDTTPSGLISNPPPLLPHFYAGCISCRNLPNLSWLGTRTKYAGLHTQWRGCKGPEQTQRKPREQMVHLENGH